MPLRRRCPSRLWTPELGADAWLACVRQHHHRGDHRAGDMSWDSTEAMRLGDIPPIRATPNSDTRDARHSLRRLRRDQTALPDAS